MTDRYAVIGNPVAHSKSPRIHAAFAKQTAQDLEYGLLPAPPGGFATTVSEFRAAGGKGLNVTVPFKLDAFVFATSLTERAREAGAVNTLKFESDTVLGDNTDGAGLVADIVDRLAFSLAGKRILLMGAGGAARGVVLPLLGQRPASIVIANRTVERADALVRQFGSRGPVRGGGYAQFAREPFDVVINATSASLAGDMPPLSPTAFAPGSLAYDMMYADQPTPFLRFALEHGAERTADGLGMLIAQAAESFFLWRGVRPDIRPVIELLRAG
jgi:shikimate dehydrogenase